jgi:formylmethanofuran dehydrogenase subunit C
MPLLLTAREDALGRDVLGVDLAGLTPDRLQHASAADVAHLTIKADQRPCLVGDLFEVAGSGNDGQMVLRGTTSRVHRVAAGMRSGSVVVEGDVGRHAAEGMHGGHVTLHGSAGDWLACGLQGGVVHVLGSAGDHAASAVPRHDRGLEGGMVLIEGSAGDLAGSRMRRGLLAIGGDCGEAAGYELAAGTVVVAGRLGNRAGAGMKRGSVIALGPTPEVWPTFSRGSVWQPPIVPMLLQWLVQHGWKSPAAAAQGPWQQWHGDFLAGGRGEIFCLPDAEGPHCGRAA